MLKLRFPLSVFRSPIEIVNGKNARMALTGIAANNVSIVISKSFKSSSLYEQILRFIKADSVNVITKSWIGEPTLNDLKGLIQRIEEDAPDYIIALGGGSIIDAAKIAWLFYECPTIDLSNMFTPFSSPKLRGKAKFAAIPTTIGSGSEVSSAAVLYDENTKSKRAVVTHDFLPDLVILDPELVSEVPVEKLRSSIADSLSHAIEGFVSKIEHPLMDAFAEKAVSIINNESSNFHNNLSMESIINLQNAAMLSGIVQNHCIVGMSHAIAHQLSSFGISHGLANCILMPQVIDFNIQDNLTKLKYEKLIHNSGLRSISDLKNLFIKLLGHESIKINLSDNDLSNICTQALEDPAARTNPVSFTSKDIERIIEILL